MKKRTPDIYTSRRRFMSLCAAAAATVPYAGLMLRQRAQAQGASPIRFVGIFSPHGCAHDLWRPRAAGGGTATATDFSFDFPNSHLAPLQEWRDQLVVVDGVDFRANYESGGFGGHERGITTCMTGGTNTGTHPSIDQYLAGRIDHAPVRSLELGVGIQSQAGPGAWDLVTMCWDERGHGVENIIDPKLTYDRLFGGFVDPGMGGGEEQARQQRRRLAALTHSLEQTRLLEAELRGVEREKLQAHLESLESIRRGLDTMPVGECAVPMRQDLGEPQPAVHEAMTDSQIDLIAQGFACDIMRVASLQVHYAGHGTPAEYMLDYPGFGGGDYHFDLHNNVAHQQGNSAEDDARVSQVGQYHASKVARLLALLDVPDPLGEGTILDNTVIYWTNELGNPAAHHNVGVPTVIAGGGGGRIQRGQYLQVRSGLPSWNQFDELYPHNRVLTSVCNAMGFDDVDYYGNDEFRGASPYMGPVEGLLV